MPQVWNPQISYWYEQAMRWSNYPQKVFCNIFQDEIRKSDTVLDAGSGNGAIALHVASLCRRVIAVDKQPEALEILQEKANKLGMQNIETRLGIWPEVDVEKMDVTICAYSPPVSRCTKGLEKLLYITGRTGIILTLCLIVFKRTN